MASEKDQASDDYNHHDFKQYEPRMISTIQTIQRNADGTVSYIDLDPTESSIDPVKRRNYRTYNILRKIFVNLATLNRFLSKVAVYKPNAIGDSRRVIKNIKFEIVGEDIAIRGFDYLGSPAIAYFPTELGDPKKHIRITNANQLVVKGGEGPELIHLCMDYDQFIEIFGYLSQ